MPRSLGPGTRRNMVSFTSYRCKTYADLAVTADLDGATAVDGAAPRLEAGS